MCGIFLAISRIGPIYPDSELERLLRSRGPDRSQKHHVVVGRYCSPNDSQSTNTLDGKGSTGTGTIHISSFSSVLFLRGSSPTAQPYTESTYGGSFLCWNGEAWIIDGVPVTGSDTAAVFTLLQQACQQTSEIQTRAATISRALSRISGPYALAFYDAAHGRVYFGRDFFGRRSLLTRTTAEGALLVSSVTNGKVEDGWKEVEADGVYFVDLTRQPAPSDTEDFRVEKESYCFQNVGNVDAGPSVISRLILNRTTAIDSNPLPVSSSSRSVLRLEQLLRSSLASRVLNIPIPPSTPAARLDGKPTSLAILFSGGLDCTVLARLSHDFFTTSESVDLLNVAFENPRSHGNAPDPYEICPDRITGRSSYAELTRFCSGRVWRFVAINIAYTEVLVHRDQIIRLMHPHNTEMDLSIAMALYFAARGSGTINDPSDGKCVPYTTSARVLLSGLGADELFAGYTRHATAFSRSGYEGLLSELELDIGRLGKRNLGRDDRVVSHWGRETRLPYLDEELVAWAVNAPLRDKCGFGEDITTCANGSEKTEPDKKVLRCLALKLGMTGAAGERKRAIQFGARTAKMQRGNAKGTTVLS